MIIACGGANHEPHAGDGAAALAIGVGINAGWIAGSIALNAANDAKGDCNQALRYCNRSYEKDAATARAAASVSTVAFAAAGAGVLYLVLETASPDTHVSATVTPSGVAVGGSF